MGGDLRKAPDGKAPTFLVAALRDPIGANLDRIQIVKGWQGEDGKLHEKVHDVVWSGSRKLNIDGKLPPVGNTVDLEMATYANTIGTGFLGETWKGRASGKVRRAIFEAAVPLECREAGTPTD